MPHAPDGRHAGKHCGMSEGRKKGLFVLFITRRKAEKEAAEPPFFCIHSAFMMLRGDGYSALATAGTCQSMPKVQELSLTAGAH